jgi:hypothetical protein
MKELHRHSWICDRGLPLHWLAYLPDAERQEYWQHKQEEYANTFPENGVDGSDASPR